MATRLTWDAQDGKEAATTVYSMQEETCGIQVDLLLLLCSGLYDSLHLDQSIDLYRSIE